MSLAEYIIMTEVRETQEHAEEKRYAEVILDSAVQELDRPFTYEIPQKLLDRVETGSMVLVPFSGRLEVGFVVGTPSESDTPRIKEISRIIDEPPLFDFNTQRLCRWIADRYISSLSQAFRLVLPPGRSRKVKQHIELLESSQEGLLFDRGATGMEALLLERLSSAGGTEEIATLKKELGGDIVRTVRTQIWQTNVSKLSSTGITLTSSPRIRTTSRGKEGSHT